jgi:hypothetical protein
MENVPRRLLGLRVVATRSGHWVEVCAAFSNQNEWEARLTTSLGDKTLDSDPSADVWYRFPPGASVKVYGSKTLTDAEGVDTSVLEVENVSPFGIGAGQPPILTAGVADRLRPPTKRAIDHAEDFDNESGRLTRPKVSLAVLAAAHRIAADTSNRATAGELRTVLENGPVPACHSRRQLERTSSVLGWISERIPRSELSADVETLTGLVLDEPQIAQWARSPQEHGWTGPKLARHIGMLAAQAGLIEPSLVEHCEQQLLGALAELHAAEPKVPRQ